jgi:hypothetical protein
VALREFAKAEGWSPDELWIAPDKSGHAAIWRASGPDELLRCMGHVASERFTALIAAATVARFAAPAEIDNMPIDRNKT